MQNSKGIYKKKYPHLVGYFDRESIGVIDREITVKEAQEKFFISQKEMLEATELDDDKYHASGKYVDDSRKLVSAENGLVFWGEWEAEAKMSVISEYPEKGVPKYLVEPLKIEKYIKGGMNKDPCVFGHCFRYSLCRQNDEHGKGLLDLDSGSIILFGSGLEESFLVDTVFVVSSSKKYNLKTMRKDLKDIQDFEEYKKLVIDSIESGCSSKEASVSSGNGCAGSSFADSADSKKNMTFYEGATFSNPVGMSNKFRTWRSSRFSK